MFTRRLPVYNRLVQYLGTKPKMFLQVTGPSYSVVDPDPELYGQVKSCFGVNCNRSDLDAYQQDPASHNNAESCNS
jgi:hypothetical protein